MTTVISYYDYLLLIPYVIIFFLIARWFAKKNAETSNEFYWLLINWWLKMVAGILYAWMIVYYYGYGDPIGYKDRSDTVLESIGKNWGNIKYIFLPVKYIRDYILSFGYTNLGYLTVDFAYYTEPNFMISRVGSIAGLLCFNRFLLISFIFTNIAYYGFILIYTASKKIIKGYNKELAIACLFIPSCIFWSSGYAKEPVCIIAIGIMFNSVIKIFFEKKFSLLTIFNLVFFSFVLFTVKNYIFFSFAIAFLFWMIYNLIRKIISKSFLFKILFVAAFLFSALTATWVFGKSISRLFTTNLRDIISSNIDMYEAMATRQRGSFIEVKNIDVSSLTGILKFIPQGMVNVFFRPFPWEILNVLMVFTVLENLFFIYLFFKIFIQSKFFTRGLFINKNYQIFAICFTFVLGFAIAISTFNFGSMVRYKMPFLPFWASFLLIINTKLKRESSVAVL